MPAAMHVEACTVASLPQQIKHFARTIAKSMTHQPGKDGKPGRKIRTDARRMAEVICTLPTELFVLEGKARERAEAAWFRATDEWVRTQPGDAVARAVHRDEARMHIHYFIHPVTPDGRLSYRDCYESPAKLRAAQASYSAALAPLEVQPNSEEVKAELADGYGDDWRTFKKRKEAMEQREAANAATAQALADQEEIAEAHREESEFLREECGYWRDLFHQWRAFTNRLRGTLAEIWDMMPAGTPDLPEPPEEPPPPPSIRRRRKPSREP